MDVGPSFVANPEAAILVQPSKRPLDNLAVDPQSAAVRSLLSRQRWLDAPLPPRFAMQLGIEGSVYDHGVLPRSQATRFVCQRGDGIERR